MLQPSLARVDNARWRLSSRFPKDFQDHNGVLQPAEQISRFNPRYLGKGRRLDLAVKPAEGLLPRSQQWDKLCQI